MTSTQYNPIQAHELPTLYALWYDKVVLEQPRNVPLPQTTWCSALLAGVDAGEYTMTCRTVNGRLLGFVWGAYEAESGRGLLRTLVIDLHATDAHNQGGRGLVAHFVSWLKARGASMLWVGRVRLPVEQAFWTSLGAKNERGVYSLQLK
jgi:hypothetical protein